MPGHFLAQCRTHGEVSWVAPRRVSPSTREKASQRSHTVNRGPIQIGHHEITERTEGSQLGSVWPQKMSGFLAGLE